MDGRSLETGVRRIIVLGGLGLFGRTAVDELRQLGMPVLTASRSAAADLRIDANRRESIDSTLRAGDIVLDAAGPFYLRSTALLDAAIQIGFDVVDLNDDLEYAESVVALEPQIAEAGICVLSSASSVSAVSAAAVRHSGVQLPRRVDAFLAPASRHTANSGSAMSLWRSVGRPVRVLRNGQLETRIGWLETRRFSMPRPVGRIEGHLFESADAVNLPRIWPSMRDVAMWVDTNTIGVNSLLQMAAYSEPLRELMEKTVTFGTWLAKKIGSSAGGIGYEIEDADGRVATVAIVASENSFMTAVAPAVLAVRAIATERFQLRGLVPPDRHVAAGDLIAHLEQHGIVVSELK